MDHPWAVSKAVDSQFYHVLPSYTTWYYGDYQYMNWNSQNHLCVFFILFYVFWNHVTRLAYFIVTYNSTIKLIVIKLVHSSSSYSSCWSTTVPSDGWLPDLAHTSRVLPLVPRFESHSISAPWKHTMKLVVIKLTSCSLKRNNGKPPIGNPFKR